VAQWREAGTTTAPDCEQAANVKVTTDGCGRGIDDCRDTDPGCAGVVGEARHGFASARVLNVFVSRRWSRALHTTAAVGRRARAAPTAAAVRPARLLMPDLDPVLVSLTRPRPTSTYVALGAPSPGDLPRVRPVGRS